jgi:hypothetical protein
MTFQAASLLGGMRIQIADGTIIETACWHEHSSEQIQINFNLTASSLLSGMGSPPFVDTNRGAKSRQSRYLLATAGIIENEILLEKGIGLWNFRLRLEHAA